MEIKNLQINFDLIDCMEKAKTNPQFALVKEHIKTYFPFALVLYIISSIGNVNNLIAILSTIRGTLIVVIMSNSYDLLTETYLTSYGAGKLWKEVNSKIYEAQQNLLTFLTELKEAGININSLEDLSKGKRKRTKYKLTRNNNKWKVFQHKYVNIPVRLTEEETSNILVHQEREIFNDRWNLSLSFAPAKKGIFS